MLSRWKTIERIEAICEKHNVTVTFEQGTYLHREKIQFIAPPNKVFRRFPHSETQKSFYWKDGNLIGIIGWVKMWMSLLEEEQQQ